MCLTYQELESDWFAEAKSEHADSVRHLGSGQSFTARAATPSMIYRKLKSLPVDYSNLEPKTSGFYLFVSSSHRAHLGQQLEGKDSGFAEVGHDANGDCE